MAAASSATSFFGIREEDQNQMKQQQQSSIPTSSTAPATAPQKKKRNLPGTPNPDAEVIALSPKTLMATNRFICEVCNKGFQREQNLQLHRRGHNLPWKLKQKTTKEVKRRVYLCPEPTCVHHDPSRALGDLTGIKKHFCRKHGEKKWKCDKCSKRYAVQSDWKAHSKTCGTREYRCDCGTLFSRRDSFVTHRAFCDALAQESARLPTGLNTMGSHLYGSSTMGLALSQVGSQISSLQDQNHPSSDLLRLGGAAGGAQFDHLISPSNPSSSSFRPPQSTHSSAFFLTGTSSQEFHEEPQSHHGLLQTNKPFHGLMQLPELQGSTNNSSSAAAGGAVNPFNLGFFSHSSTNNSNNANSNNSHLNSSGLLIPEQFNNGNDGGEGASLFSGNLMGDHIGSSVSSLFSNSVQNDTVNMPQMSATALLQKAAQMGSTRSTGSGSLLRGFGSSSSSGPKSDRPQHLIANFRANFEGGGSENLRASQLENENHLHDLMNSLAHGGSSINFGAPSGGVPTFGMSGTSGGHEQETNFGGFNPNRMSLEHHHHPNTNFGNMEEPKLHQNLTVSLGGSDRLTRDFLGVGGMVRGMGGGMSQRDHQQHHAIDISSLDSEIKSATGRSFVGSGNLQ